MYRPRYETELEVSRAVAEGKISFLNTMQAYAEARQYQAELKAANKCKFFRKPTGKTVIGMNWRPGYATR